MSRYLKASDLRAAGRTIHFSEIDVVAECCRPGGVCLTGHPCMSYPIYSGESPSSNGPQLPRPEWPARPGAGHE